MKTQTQTEAQVIMNYRLTSHTGQWKINPITKEKLIVASDWYRLKETLENILTQDINEEETKIVKYRLAQLQEKLNIIDTLGLRIIK